MRAVGNCSDYSLCFLFTRWCHNSTVLPSKTVNRDPITTLFSQHYLSYTQTVSVSHILCIPALKLVHICISSNKSTCHLLDRKKWGSKIGYIIFLPTVNSDILLFHILFFTFKSACSDTGLDCEWGLNRSYKLAKTWVVLSKLEWNIVHLCVLFDSVTSCKFCACPPLSYESVHLTL